LGLTTAEGQKLEGFKLMKRIFLQDLENQVNPLISKVIMVFHSSMAVFMYIP
jgi:hypothetical protein